MRGDSPIQFVFIQWLMMAAGSSVAIKPNAISIPFLEIIFNILSGCLLCYAFNGRLFIIIFISFNNKYNGTHNIYGNENGMQWLQHQRAQHIVLYSLFTYFTVMYVSIGLMGIMLKMQMFRWYPFHHSH